jgi:hypothetical protein
MLNNEANRANVIAMRYQADLQSLRPYEFVVQHSWDDVGKVRTGGKKPQNTSGLRHVPHYSPSDVEDQLPIRRGGVQSLP